MIRSLTRQALQKQSFALITLQDTCHFNVRNMQAFFQGVHIFQSLQAHFTPSLPEFTVCFSNQLKSGSGHDDVALFTPHMKTRHRDGDGEGL